MHAARIAKPGTKAFETISLDQLEGLSHSELDQLPFGVIGMNAGGEVEVFSATESRLAGLSAQEVIGSRFFTEYGRCMNNQRVAGRFEEQGELDEILDHVLTFRMKVAPAKLRMLSSASSRLKYLLIQR